MLATSGPEGIGCCLLQESVPPQPDGSCTQFIIFQSPTWAWVSSILPCWVPQPEGCPISSRSFLGSGSFQGPQFNKDPQGNHGGPQAPHLTLKHLWFYLVGLGLWIQPRGYLAFLKGLGGLGQMKGKPCPQPRSGPVSVLGSQAQKSSGVSGIVPCCQINCVERLGFLSQIQFKTQRWYLGFHFLPYHIYIDGDLNTFIDQGIFVEINTCVVNMFLVNNVLTVSQNKINYTWRCFVGEKKFKW